MLGTLAAFGLLASSAAWALLARWLPIQGKARLIQELEHRFPVEVSIGALRYAPLRGFVVEALEVVEPATGQVWLAAPRAVIGVRWLPLLLARTAAFRITAPIVSPCQTDLVLDGAYSAKTQAVSLHLRTGELPLATLQPPLSEHVPAALRAGSVRLNLRYAGRPHAPPT